MLTAGLRGEEQHEVGAAQFSRGRTDGGPTVRAGAIQFSGDRQEAAQVVEVLPGASLCCATYRRVANERVDANARRTVRARDGHFDRDE